MPCLQLKWAQAPGVQWVTVCSADLSVHAVWRGLGALLLKWPMVLTPCEGVCDGDPPYAKWHALHVKLAHVAVRGTYAMTLRARVFLGRGSR
jgi:hypothetical protein